MECIEIKDFERRVLQSEKPTIVVIHSNYCNKVYAIVETILSDIERKFFKDMVNGRSNIPLLYKLNILEGENRITIDYNITITPMLLFFKNGALLDSSSDILSYRNIVSFIQRNLN